MALSLSGSGLCWQYGRLLVDRQPEQRCRPSLFQQGRSPPEVVTLDKSGANKAAVDGLNAGKQKKNHIKIRQNTYLNNLIEQDGIP
ncbi:hypothetical protein XBKB1_3550004 [Xenorhabdus bovienii str. kraussei Becker Underwood]|uniref:Uncharacterized protein n=1 Tax=Xenorhabdus bovienii str. kraussei Becker Underwood TaxID=1398204 RepID=A0A077PKW0_XENBV|nr:hypothetical protein XBKB1_3550004 [Xenorhabdus bovienii str. kraussei Becker Underwood]